MNKEKVISYLNVRTEGKIDKSLVQICMGFNIGVTVLMLVVAILLFRPSNYYVYILFAVFDVMYFIFLIMYRNPLWQFPLTAIGLVVLAVKLFFGYILASQYEFVEGQIPKFTCIHAGVLVLAIGVAVYFWAKCYQAYKITKNNTIETAQKKIAAKNPMPKWAASIAALSGSPMVIYRLLRDDIKNLGLGMGFGMWALGVIFVLIFAMLVPKLIVLIRFRAWEFPEFRNKKY